MYTRNQSSSTRLLSQHYLASGILPSISTSKTGKWSRWSAEQESFQLTNALKIIFFTYLLVIRESVSHLTSLCYIKVCRVHKKRTVRCDSHSNLDHRIGGHHIWRLLSSTHTVRAYDNSGTPGKHTHQRGHSAGNFIITYCANRIRRREPRESTDEY